MIAIIVSKDMKNVNPNRKARFIFMRRQLNITEGIFPMPVLMVATYNEDGSVNVMNAAGNHAGTGHGSIEPYRIP